MRAFASHGIEAERSNLPSQQFEVGRVTVVRYKHMRALETRAHTVIPEIAHTLSSYGVAVAEVNFGPLYKKIKSDLESGKIANAAYELDWDTWPALKEKMIKQKAKVINYRRITNIVLGTIYAAVATAGVISSLWTLFFG